MKQEKIYTQHSENNEWMNNVAFYQDEMKFMGERLQEIASKNTSEEVLKQVEHFQNKFIVHEERLDELKHEINVSNDALNKEIEKNTTALDRRKVKDHSTAREEMQNFEKTFTSMKAEFYTFLSKWM